MASPAAAAAAGSGRKRSGSISEDLSQHDMPKDEETGVELIKESLEGATEDANIHVFVVMGASVSDTCQAYHLLVLLCLLMDIEVYSWI